MANTRFQLKRSSVSGVIPTTGDIASGELGINLADKKLFTSNGSAVFELGTNVTNLSVTSNLTVGASGKLVLSNGAALYANGSVGSSGQLLASNGSSVYWTSASGTGSVTSVDSGSGLTGGPITAAGTLSVLANNGVTANSTGVFVTPGAGITVNATGVHVNSSYIETLTANAAGFLGNSSGTLANISSWVSGNAATAYTNAAAYADIVANNAYSNAVANAATLYQTTAGLSANVATLTANAAGFLGNSSGTLANVSSWVTSNAAAAYSNATAYADLRAADAYSNAVANAAALYQTSAGLASNVATLTANAAGFLGNSSGTLANVSSWITSNADAAYSNAVANAAALYQTTAGLSANVATLTANAAGFLGNSSGTLANIASWATGNAATAYTNATAYADAAASNAYSNAVANAAALYQTTAGLSANVATLTANAAGFLGNSSGTLANVASWITGNSATAYTNATSYADTKANAAYSNGVSYTDTKAGEAYSNAASYASNVASQAYSNAVANAAALYQTTAGLAANVATLAANSASFLGNSSGTIANVASWITGNSATAYTNATSYADLVAANAYANAVANSAALYQTTAGLAANVATLTANNSTNLNGQPASFYTNATNLATGTVPTARLGSGTANSATFLSGDQSYKTAVTSVASGDGLSGGPITTAGTLSVQANNGITSNASGVFVRAGTGVTVNATGVHIGQAVGTTDAVTFGSLSVTGNSALGDATADIVSINGSVNTNIMPSANVTYGLGNSTMRWSQVHVANVHAVTGKFDGNVEIGGDLILTGSVSNVSVTDLIVSDPLIHIGANNEVSDLVDLGWVGHYSDDGGATKRHAGLFRDATDGTFKLFRNLVQADLDTANALTINTAAASYSTATLQTFLSSGALTSNTTAVTIAANSTVNVAIVANTVTADLFTGNVTGTASNAVNLNNQPASFYTNATNISTGTLDNTRLPANISITSVNAATLSVGTAVVANSGGLTTSGNVTIGSAGDLVLQSGAGIVANGSLGSNGQVLFSNGSSVYWSNAAGSSSAVVSQQFTANGTANSFTISGGYLPGAVEVYVAGVKQTPGTDVVISSGSTVDFAVAPLTGQIVDVFGFVGVGSIVATGTVTSVASGAGLTGGPITSSGTLSVQANNGVTANSTGLFVTQGTGAVVNATGVHVNASYIGTISANNASFLGGTVAASYQLNSTLAANVATLAANSATFANSSATNTFTVGTASYFVANGNFGVGTASPATLLDVNGRATVRGDRILQVNDGSTYEIGPGAGSGNTSVWGLFAPAGRATGLFSNAVERIRIDTNGNVGVGNIAPDARLTVTGAANVSGNVVIGGTLNSGNVTASLFTGNVTGTASNATNLNSQPGSFYTNATNITTGTLPWAQAPSGTVNTSGAFTYSGVQTFGANVRINSSSFTIANATANVFQVLTPGFSGESTQLAIGQIGFVGGALLNVWGNTYINKTLIIDGGGGIQANGSLGTSGQVLSSNGSGIYWSTPAPAVNTAAQFAWTNLHSFSANLHTGNSTVNTQISNSTTTYNGSNASLSVSSTQISLTGNTSNAAATSTFITPTEIRLGGTTTNVVISNTTSSFGGNVVITGSANVAANLTIGASGELIISNGAGIQANGTFGTSGHALFSNGTGVYWAAVPASVNTAAQFSWTNTHFFSANVTIADSSELIIQPGAGIEANGSFGSDGQVLTSNGSSVYWASPPSGTLAYRTITANTTILSTDNLILANGTLTITLPAAATVDGRQFYIKNINNSNGVITILPSGSELIDGYANATIRYYNTMLGVISVGTGWVIF